jgi:hypothetical protein
MTRSLVPIMASIDLFACLVPNAARAADDETAKPRVTLTPRIGLGMPGSATPSQISKTKLGVGFVAHHDLVIALGDHFEIGRSSPPKRRCAPRTSS